MLRYPYGCIEQTTSKGFAALILDGQTATALGAQVMSDDVRKAAVDGALARLASYQASNGHFSFWGGTSPIQTFTTPSVVDLMMDARDRGFAVPPARLRQNCREMK